MNGRLIKSGIKAERTDAPEEDEEWWDERWKMLAMGEAHIETLKKWFGLFADEGLKLRCQSLETRIANVP